MKPLIQLLYLLAVIWAVVDVIRWRRFSTGAAVGMIAAILFIPFLGLLVYAVVRFSSPRSPDAP